MRFLLAADPRVATRALLLLSFLMVTIVAATRPSAAQKKKAPENPPDAIYLNGSVYVGATTNDKGTFVMEVPNEVVAQQMATEFRAQKVLATGRPEGSQGQSQGHRPQAIAVRGGRIVATGSNNDIRKLAGPNTQIIDLGGHFVLPGLNDAHVHLANAGFEKLNVDLVGAKSLEEMLARIAERAKSTPAGEWLLGRGWDHTLWPDQKLPTRQDLDTVTGGHPAIFTRVDGHISVANTAALKWAGITRETPDPPGGKIDRDTSGEPTGILRETVKDDLLARLPKPSREQRKRALELALADAAQHGLTSVQDNSNWDDFLAMEELEREGKLPIRVSEWLRFDLPLEELEARRAHHPANDPMLHTGMLKGFMDGSLGSRTAALLAPYSDDPSNSGLPRYQEDKLIQMTVERARAGFQIGFHAIGDRAAQMALDAFAAAEKELSKEGKNPTALRFRIEHDQVITPAQFAQYKQLGVIASVQPNHLLTDMHWAMERIGPERAKTSYPWHRFLKNDVPLAFGTDYPVEPVTPFRGLYAAVTRKDEAGAHSWYPEQKLSIDEAIAAYTTGSAYAEFTDRDKGMLILGQVADFVVLDRDLTMASPAEILKTRVLRTVVGGKTVYEAK